MIVLSSINFKQRFRKNSELKFGGSGGVFAVFVLASCFVHAALAKGNEELPGLGPPKNAESTAKPSQFVGVGSCTAAGCHGGGRAKPVVGSEYNVWIGKDAHARSFSILYDARSQRIEQLLAGEPPAAAAAAYNDQRCLVCHSVIDDDTKNPAHDQLSDGVGCEACHGPAKKWVADHFEHRLSASERKQRDMWDTDSLVARTQICVRCHVGSPGREVNHELIAAGHPQLQFEMSAYLEAMPKHWDEAKDRANWGTDFDSIVWAIGQACASQGALEQLANRASGGKAWPEFAEWSCSACHHELRDDQERQRRLSDAGGLSGQTIAWDTWNHHTLRQHAGDIGLAFGLPTEPAKQIESDLTAIDKEMRHLNADRRHVASQARGAANELGEWALKIEKSHIKPGNVDQLTRALLQDQHAADAVDWSITAQMYNALASLHETRLREAAAPRPATDQLTQAMKQLFDDLAIYQISRKSYAEKRDDVQSELSTLPGLLPDREATP
jgi:hypothetical protein